MIASHAFSVNSLCEIFRGPAAHCTPIPRREKLPFCLLSVMSALPRWAPFANEQVEAERATPKRFDCIPVQCARGTIFAGRTFDPFFVVRIWAIVPTAPCIVPTEDVIATDVLLRLVPSIQARH